MLIRVVMNEKYAYFNVFYPQNDVVTYSNVFDFYLCEHCISTYSIFGSKVPNNRLVLSEGVEGSVYIKLHVTTL